MLQRCRSLRALVSRAHKRAIAKNVGNDQAFDLAKGIDLHAVGNHKPIVAVDKQDLVRRTGAAGDR